jgi:hypothetical protein
VAALAGRLALYLGYLELFSFDLRILNSFFLIFSPRVHTAGIPHPLITAGSMLARVLFISQIIRLIHRLALQAAPAK